MASLPLSNKWLSYRNSGPCFHIFFKTLHGYYDWDFLYQQNLDFPDFFWVKFHFSPFLKAFFVNKSAPYLLLIWFIVLKFVVRFCKEQCIAHKNEKDVRVFDVFFPWHIYIYIYLWFIAVDNSNSPKDLISFFPTISANSYQNFLKI